MRSEIFLNFFFSNKLWTKGLELELELEPLTWLAGAGAEQKWNGSTTLVTVPISLKNRTLKVFLQLYFMLDTQNCQQQYAWEAFINIKNNIAGLLNKITTHNMIGEADGECALKNLAERRWRDIYDRVFLTNITIVNNRRAFNKKWLLKRWQPKNKFTEQSCRSRSVRTTDYNFSAAIRTTPMGLDRMLRKNHNTWEL